MLSPRAIAVEGVGASPIVLAVRGFASSAVVSMLGKIVATAFALVTMSSYAQIASMTQGQSGKA